VRRNVFLARRAPGSNYELVLTRFVIVPRNFPARLVRLGRMDGGFAEIREIAGTFRARDLEGRSTAGWKFRESCGTTAAGGDGCILLPGFVGAMTSPTQRGAFVSEQLRRSLSARSSPSRPREDPSFRPLAV